ncbi:MAG: hypothetical protein U0W24_25060 [Bacteroidales bacterium]
MKSKLNYSVLLLLVLSFVSIFSSCDNKEDVKPAPVVTAPGTTEVEESTAVDITFEFTAEAGYKTAIVEATNGTAVVKTQGSLNAVSGTVVVTFTAGSNIGAGSATLTVTDNDGQTSSATAVMDVVAEQTTFYISDNITQNTTWESGKVYILQSRIAVISGVTLTIEPGVVVKGEAGTAENATALLITRGAKLMAEGTASDPIIFTSIADEIMPGQIASPNLDPTLNGLWGGLLICGKARISVAGDAENKQIEGIPPSDPNGLYGGTDDADNSGVIKYISIRHGGANIGEGNEINGLTLAGVGSGTVIENVEIVSNQDDGIEFFGGTVSVNNVVVWNTGDDAIDTDQTWSGTLDNFIIINPGDKCFELDGPEGALYTANHVIQNGHVKAGNAVSLVDVDANSNVNMDDIYFYDLKAGQLCENPSATYSCIFSDFEVTLPASTVIADFFATNAAAVTTAVDAPSDGIGANPADFTGWSWASEASAF